MKQATGILINRANPIFTRLEQSLLVWNKPMAAAVLSGIIFLGLSWTAGPPWRLSSAPYYNLLADAFLHGQLNLRIVPVTTIDLSLFQGQYYLYWGPLPAIFAIPLVALFGVNISDVLQTLVVSAINVGVMALVLKAANDRGVIHLAALQQAMLILLFALGTAFTPITGSGHVWQMAQVTSILFSSLAFLSAFRLDNAKAYFWTGAALAAVLLTRQSAIFIAIFLAWYLLQRHRQQGMRRLLWYSVLGVLPVLAALGITALYNLLRFGNPLDNGLNYHLMSGYFAGDFARYGLLNLRYLPANFYYTYIFYPYSFSPFDVNVRCGSLFLLSPLFFYAIYALWKQRRAVKTWILFLAILVGNIPILLLMGPGSSLFGPRYTLDFILPLLLLTASGMEDSPNSFAALLLIISIFHYLLGTLIYLQGVP